MNNNGKFTNWALGVFTLLIIGIGSYSLKMLIDINSDVNLLKNQIYELSKTNTKIETLQEQMMLLQYDVQTLKNELREFKGVKR